MMQASDSEDYGGQSYHDEDDSFQRKQAAPLFDHVVVMAGYNTTPATTTAHE